MSVAEEKSSNKVFLGQDNNALVMLFAINGLLFIILEFIHVVYQFSDMSPDAFYPNVFNWFIMPAEITHLGARPWTLITNMFTEEKLIYFLPNMAWLWVFGYVLQDLTGNRKLIPIYIYGGVFGAFMYVVGYYIVPKLQPVLPYATLYGSNAAIMAVAIATTTVKPDYRFFPMINGGLPLWSVTLAFLVVDMASVPSIDPGRYISDLAGGAMGFLFIYQLRKGSDWSIWMNNFFDWVNDLFNPGKKEKQRNIKDEFFYKVHGSNPYKRIPNVTQKRIDGILDKINQQGYNFLTDEEKDILRRASNEDEL